MQHDPILIAETKAWFDKAISDLQLAEFVSQNQPRFLSHVAFHCQQSAEKSLKGFLTWHRQNFPKSHDLVRIGNCCASLDASLTALLQESTILTQYAWQYRYPGNAEEPSLEEAQRALSIAKQVDAEITNRIPKEAHS